MEKYTIPPITKRGKKERQSRREFKKFLQENQAEERSIGAVVAASTDRFRAYNNPADPRFMQDAHDRSKLLRTYLDLPVQMNGKTPSIYLIMFPYLNKFGVLTMKELIVPSDAISGVVTSEKEAFGEAEKILVVFSTCPWQSPEEIEIGMDSGLFSNSILYSKGKENVEASV